MEITAPLYLKIKDSYDTLKTFANPENYFNILFKVNGYEYSDTKRPLMTLNSNGLGTLDVQINLEQKELIKTKDPQLELIVDYELVDAQGNAYGGGSQVIQNKITQTT